MGEPRVRVAVIGCGGIARAHLRGYRTFREHEPDLFAMPAVCDTVRASAESFADEVASFQGSRPKVYTRVDRMLAREELDGADICTPHSLHHVNAIECLQAGLNVMVEKPIGITIRATKAIIKAAKQAKRFAATAENIRRGLSQRTGYWAINEEGLIGQPLMFFMQYIGAQDPARERHWHWRVDHWMGGGGMVMDSGAHFCDTVRYFYGDAERVAAEVRQYRKWPHRKGKRLVNDDREDTWTATIVFESGMVGNWAWSQALGGHDLSNVATYGSEGCLVDDADIFHGPHGSARIVRNDGTVHPFSDLQEAFLKSLGPEGRRCLFPHDVYDGMALEIYDFLTAIADGRAPEIDAEAGLRAKAIAEAIFESGFAGKSVLLKDVLSGRVCGYQRPIDERCGLA